MLSSEPISARTHGQSPSCQQAIKFEAAGRSQAMKQFLDSDVECGGVCVLHSGCLGCEVVKSANGHEGRGTEKARLRKQTQCLIWEGATVNRRLVVILEKATYACESQTEGTWPRPEVFRKHVQVLYHYPLTVTTTGVPFF